MSGFATSLALADAVILLEVYAASEKPIAGVSSEVIAEQMSNGTYIPNFIEATDSIIEMAKPGDVIITLGAGDVSSLGPIIVDGLTKRFPNK
jgi:UDP-N-acetylmuramate--alanine ligase